MLSEVKPTFLYPRSRQYPFDEVCEKIVRELEKRNWNVPGVSVEMDVYGTGEEKFRTVRYVKGENFKLWFCRVQGALPGGQWNDTAAVTELIIPGEEIHVYDDESGPTYIKYVGQDWEQDKAWFLASSKIHAKMRNEPRRYLVYSGKHRIPDRQGSYDWHLPNRRKPYLHSDDDLGRQYSPHEDEPLCYSTSTVLDGFRDWLQGNVLDFIKTFPEQEVASVSVSDLVPYPVDAIGPLYTYVGVDDAFRILSGQQDRERLSKGDRYALIGGRRLLSLDVPNDGTVPDLAYDGFLYCNVGAVSSDTSIYKLPIKLGTSDVWNRDHVVRVVPKYANGVYVADMAPHESYTQEIWKQNSNQYSLTDEQYAESLRMIGRTIAPIQEYEGRYEQPIVLINRELDFDEVEVVKSRLLLK